MPFRRSLGNVAHEGRWLMRLLLAALAAVCHVGLASNAVAAQASGAPPTSRMGSLLISLPDSELPQIVNLDSPQTLVAHPDRNAKDSRFYGSNRYYFKIQNVGFKQDTFSVFSSTTGRLEYVAKGIPRVWEAEPSPSAAGVFSLVFLDTGSDNGLFAILDLSNEQRVLASYKGAVGKFLHWWMPDGSLRRLHAHSGEMSVWRGSLNGVNERIEWQSLGTIPPPVQGAIFGMASPSPNGAELVLSTVQARTRKVDLWMADLQSSGLQRITNDGFVSFVTWSPDGKHFLFQRSNQSSINTSFQGQCSYWIAPGSVRNVSDVVPGIAHSAVRQVFYGSQQSQTSLPCGKVAAWFK